MLKNTATGWSDPEVLLLEESRGKNQGADTLSICPAQRGARDSTQPRDLLERPREGRFQQTRGSLWVPGPGAAPAPEWESRLGPTSPSAKRAAFVSLHTMLPSGPGSVKADSALRSEKSL